jgi:lipopolysaccharide export system protein LptA
MNKKTAIQVLLICLIFLITLSFYLKYFNNDSKIVDKSLLLKKVNINQNNSSTYIDNINYVSSDTKGNEYQMTAEQAEIKVENPDVMHLINVIAYIFVKNSDTIKITSDFGKYNSKNYDTIFSENVIITYPDHKITGEFLDFSFLRNLGIISINVIYNGNKTNLFADKIEINLTTKDTKIFMNDTNKQVLIEGTK